LKHNTDCGNGNGAVEDIPLGGTNSFLARAIPALLLAHSQIHILFYFFHSINLPPFLTDPNTSLERPISLDSIPTPGRALPGSSMV
jgi:hypothetical protein